jgi:hypothetical protein
MIPMFKRLAACLGVALLMLGGCHSAAKKTAPVKTVTKAAAAKAEDLYLQGVYAYAAGDTKGAMALWDKALAHNPRHQKTLDAMREARGKMKAVKELKKN